MPIIGGNIFLRNINRKRDIMFPWINKKYLVTRNSNIIMARQNDKKKNNCPSTRVELHDPWEKTSILKTGSGMHASLLKWKGAQRHFYLGKISGTCQFLLEHFKGTMAMTGGMEANASVPRWRINQACRFFWIVEL